MNLSQPASWNCNPFKCTECKGVHYVTTSEQRAHLERDRKHAITKGTQVVSEALPPSTSHPIPFLYLKTSESHPEGPLSHHISDFALDNGAIPDLFGYKSPPLDSQTLHRPTRMAGVTASALGTPQSPAKLARIQRAEWSAMLLEEELQKNQGSDLMQNAGIDDWEGEQQTSSSSDSAGNGKDELREAPSYGPVEDIQAGQVEQGSDYHTVPLHRPAIPQHKWDENSPDPFCAESGTHAPPPPPSPATVHPDAGVYMLYTLVDWLHSQFHVPFRACNTILVVIALIIHSFGIVTSAPVLTTLPTVMGHLGVEPTFRVLPVCPHCLEVYPKKPKARKKCTVCNTDLFKTGCTRGGKKRASQEPVPELQFLYKSLASQLAEIVALPGMEDELDQWRHEARKPGSYSDFFDGGIARDLRDHKGGQFFANHGLNVVDRPNGELCIGLTLSADWYVIFSETTELPYLPTHLRFLYLRSQIAPSHTSAPISFNIINLPADHRYASVTNYLSTY